MKKLINGLTTTLKENKSFLLFVLLMSIFRSAVADWYTVPTGSMQPTIEIGDRITVNKMAYDLRVPFTNISIIRTGEPKRGEIIVFESEKADNRLIKRVVGLPGDIISMTNEQLIINGSPVNYTFKNESSTDFIVQENLASLSHIVRFDKSRNALMGSFKAVKVPEDHYLVLGDNRRNSADSRVHGFIPRSELKGKASHVAFSIDYDNYYLPKENRFAESLY